ncbi:chloride channel [Geopyxis carbonaria]|nr:chloride channel [Geopyxis carbonaria]
MLGGTGRPQPLSSSNPLRATIEPVDDEDDPVSLHYQDQVPLESDPDPISFKRRQKPSRFSIFSSATTSGTSTSGLAPPAPAYSSPLNHSDTSLDDLTHPKDSTDAPEAWSEGVGRRIYDDLTAIDWIFEYTKERLRLQALGRRSGLLGYIAQLWDSSKIWIVLVGTGILAGVMAAAIDIVTNWLGDLKDGYCRTNFYLSRSFCCWGLDAGEKCEEWAWWSQALHLDGTKGGTYITEYMFYITFSIIFAATAGVLVKHFAPYARHSGIPEIKTLLGGFVIRKFLGTWTLVIKSLGLCLAESSGMWLGKEGPLVHVACCCANLMMKPFGSINKNEALKREVLSAAASAGISVAFGSPIGGVLFSLEQLSYYFGDKTMWKSFVCAMVAAVTLQYLDPFRTGKLVLYQVKYTRGWHGFEMVPFCILGILGGLYGAFFIKLNMKIADWRKHSIAKKFPVLEVVIVALVTALINYPTVFMRPQSSELVANLFQECSPNGEDFFGLCQAGQTPHRIVLLVLSAALGIVLSAATFGLQLPAGIILPSMAIGALYGRAMGMFVQAWQRNHPTAWPFTSCSPDIECVTPGTFAIIGAASALGGVTRMTVSIVVITFELTGALTYVLPIMIAVMISKWTGDAFGKRGIYESWIAFKAYPYLDNRDDPVPDVPAAEIMTRIEDLVVITETGHTIDSLTSILRDQPYKGFPIVADTRAASLVGYISRSELRVALAQATMPPDTECVFSGLVPGATFVDMRPWMDQTPITLAPNANLGLAASLFQKLGLRYILFARHGELQGLLTKKDVYFVLNSEEREEGRLVRGVGNDGADGGEGRRLLSTPLGDDDGASEITLEPESPGEERGLLGGL